MSKQSPEEQKRTRKIQRDQELEDFRQIVSTPGGRRFMWALLARANIFGPCFSGDSRTYYREGQREFALPLFNDWLLVAPEAYVQAVNEHKQEPEQNA